MCVRELSQTDWATWDCFVRHTAGGLPQHLAAWQQVLANTYGFETPYLGLWREDRRAPQGERLVGVMPLYFNESALVGRTLSTLPGGLCAEDDAAAVELIEAAKEMAQRLRAKRLVLHDTHQAWPGDLQTTCQHEHWIVDLREGEEAAWSALDRNIRRQVRMAQRNELVALVDRTGERLDDFYTLMSRFTHSVGTPVFGRRFLREVIAAFPDGFNIVMVYHKDAPIAGYFQLELGDTNYGVWGGALHETLDLRPVYLAFWTIITDTIAQKRAYLDMGRSPAGTNASKYKGQWATFSKPVYQQTWSLSGAGSAGVAVQAQSDGRFQLVRHYWPKLPLPIAEAVGPWLRRHVPFA